MTAREDSIVDTIERKARKIPGLLLRKRHGTAFGFAGDPDLTGCWRGRHIEIEVKQPGEKPSPLQLRRMGQWRDAGALVFVCTSAAEFTKRLEEEERLACSSCGSLNVEPLEGRAPTGVVAPDGGEEWRSYTGVYCRTCGEREER